MCLPDWARAYDRVSDDGAAPRCTATIRHLPADFDVTEVLGFDVDGEGEHDYLYIEKVGTNTEWLARQLAQFAAVPAKDVGYAGLKDRHAVTRQWYSVPRWHAPEWNRLRIDGVTVRDVQRHSKKLRRGAHRRNQFKIVLRDVVGDPDILEQRLNLIDSGGVPNYFGPQRFGRNGANIGLADSWSAGARLPRHKRSLAISSARSYLFNDWLQTRVLDESWNRLQVGDVANLDGSGSVFSVDELDDALVARCRELDLHPTGVLWGDSSDLQQVRNASPKWLKALTNARVKPAHRSLRLRVHDLQWHYGPNTITLEFALGRGTFATSVLREIGNIVDASAPGAMSTSS